MLFGLKKKLAQDGQIYLKIKAIPGAPKTEFKNIMADGTIKIAVAAAPEKGRANAALLEFLAAEFGVLPRATKLISGAAGRNKLVKIEKIYGKEFK